MTGMPDLAGPSDAELAQMLIGATAPDVPGRRALAKRPGRFSVSAAIAAA
jgi:hypothetical protein